MRKRDKRVRKEATPEEPKRAAHGMPDEREEQRIVDRYLERNTR